MFLLTSYLLFFFFLDIHDIFPSKIKLGENTVLCSIKKEIWFVLISIFILAFLLNIEYSAVNLILVAISKDFNEDLNVLQWLLSGYTLAWAATAIIGGRLSDIYGNRRMFFIGVWIFCIAALLCGCAWNTWILILGRIIQGIGGGLFVAPLYSILFLSSPEKKRGFTMGLIGIFCGAGLAFGPSIGGTLLKLLSWHWVFFINIPLCLTALWLMYTFDKSTPPDSCENKIDVPGFFLISFSIIFFLFTLNQSEVWGVTNPLFLSFIAISALLFFIFFKYEKHQKEKTIPLDLLKNKGYVGCFIGVSLFEYVFSSLLLLINLYLQNTLHFSAYESGLIFLSMTLSFAIFSFVGGKMCDIVADGRLPLCGGMVLTGIGALWASGFTAETELIYITLALFIIGSGQGLTFPCLNAIMLKTVRPSVINTASGLFSVGICMFLAIGVVISSSLLTGFGQMYLVDMLPKSLPAYEVSALTKYISNAYHDIKELHTLSNPEYLNIFVIKSYMSALRATIIISASVSFFAAAFCFFTIRNIPQNQPTNIS